MRADYDHTLIADHDLLAQLSWSIDKLQVKCFVWLRSQWHPSQSTNHWGLNFQVHENWWWKSWSDLVRATVPGSLRLQLQLRGRYPGPMLLSRDLCVEPWPVKNLKNYFPWDHESFMIWVRVIISIPISTRNNISLKLIMPSSSSYNNESESRCTDDFQLKSIITSSSYEVIQFFPFEFLLSEYIARAVQLFWDSGALAASPQAIWVYWAAASLARS